jgi:hypothetical protein
VDVDDLQGVPLLTTIDAQVQAEVCHQDLHVARDITVEDRYPVDILVTEVVQADEEGVLPPLADVYLQKEDRPGLHGLHIVDTGKAVQLGIVQ